jgi:sugar phosphate permease
MQLSAALGRVAWGWLSDALFGGDRTLPLAVVCFVSGCGVLTIGLGTGTLPLLALCAVVVGFTGNGWTGLFSVALAEIGGTRFAGTALGLGSSLTFSAAVVGPVLFGVIADAFGLHASWTALAFLLMLGVIPAFVAHYRFVKRRGLLEGDAAASG